MIYALYRYPLNFVVLYMLYSFNWIVASPKVTSWLIDNSPKFPLRPPFSPCHASQTCQKVTPRCQNCFCVSPLGCLWRSRDAASSLVNRLLQLINVLSIKYTAVTTTLQQQATRSHIPIIQFPLLQLPNSLQILHLLAFSLLQQVRMEKKRGVISEGRRKLIQRINWTHLVGGKICKACQNQLIG